jgi:exoribonuclease R
MTYKLKVNDRQYEKWSVYHSSSLILADISLNPIQHKLFDQDIFSLDDREKITLEHSCVHIMRMIPGVLVLVGNKTYGKWKRDRYLFKCIPDDCRLPIFLVPYKIKYGFSKKLKNKYITFKFVKWDGKHPQGSIVQTIGDVDKLSNFYEYQLYCKSLYASIQKFTKAAMRALKKKSEDQYITMILDQYAIEDRREEKIYTIDPAQSKDFDDGFGIISLGDTSWKLSVYISNVSLWFDVMDLWTSFSQRIATIYLPDRRRPMLPTILSNALCSLQENRTRFAFTLDVVVENYTIKSISYCNTCIRVTKNYVYDSPELERNPEYQTLLKVVKKMNIAKKYIDNIRDSHDVVAYLMVMMNFLSAQKLREHRCGIYRAVTLSSTKTMPSGAPESVKKFLKGWMSSGGRYVNFANIAGHELLDLEAYIHITSPIRRLIDLLNIMNLQDKLGICKYSEKSKVFHEKWGESLEYINTTMRAIRKVQNDCSLLNMFADKKQLLEKEYDGFIFESIERNDGLFQYLVYLPQLNMTNRITLRHKLLNNTSHIFKIFIFMDEERLKQKIRLEYIPK